MMQLPLAGIVPPVSVAVFAPVETVPAPQVVDAAGGAAIASDATGSVSVSDALVSATPLGLVNVSVTVDVSTPPWSVVGRKALAPVTGCSAATVSVAFAICGFDPCDDETAPTGMRLMNTPAAGDVTSTVTVHWPATPAAAAGIVPPETEKLLAPGVAVTAAPHVVVGFAGLATTTVPGRLSVNAVPVAVDALLLSRMTVSVEI